MISYRTENSPIEMIELLVLLQLSTQKRISQEM